MRTSVAEAVRGYLDARPLVREAMAMGIVNYSALVRQIEGESGLDRHDAILTALRRYDAGIVPDGMEADVRAALARSRLEMRTHVGLLTYHAGWPLLERLAKALGGLGGPAERVHIMHGWEDISVVADDRLLDDLARRLGEDPLDRRNGLAELNLRCDDAGVPGFLAATTTALARRGINVIDAASCRQDHLFLIDEQDLAAAIEAVDALRA